MMRVIESILFVALFIAGYLVGTMLGVLIRGYLRRLGLWRKAPHPWNWRRQV